MQVIYIIVVVVFIMYQMLSCSRSDRHESPSHNMTRAELKQVEREAIERTMSISNSERDIRQSVIDHHTQ